MSDPIDQNERPDLHWCHEAARTIADELIYTEILSPDAEEDAIKVIEQMLFVWAISSPPPKFP